MASSHAEESYYDSQAALRLVDAALTELREDDLVGPDGELTAETAEHAASVGLLGLARILVRAYAEITSVIKNLRESRAMLEDAAVSRLHHTHDKLREVSSATEVAATDILNRLETAVSLVDTLEGDDHPARSEAAGALREELFAMMGTMQFQDITAQQLSYASAVLVEMEQRLSQLARIFDPAAFGVAHVEPATPTGAFDPAASTQNAEVRQAVADAIFSDPRKVG
jgi:chemotaxis regulatin CheY-phosphate phosphatase CheZ